MRNFTAERRDAKWVGDMTEIPTVDGQGRPGPKLYLATVIDLYSRRLLGAATGRHPDADLACAAIKMAAAARGGKAAIWREDEAERVIFHTDRGSTYTANSFTLLCRQIGIRQSMGRVGSCFDNAAAEAFFSLAGVGGPLPTRVREHPSGPGRCAGLVLRVLQPRAAAQLGGHDEPGQLREHRGPRPGSRIGKPSTIRGEPQRDRAPLRGHRADDRHRRQPRLFPVHVTGLHCGGDPDGLIAVLAGALPDPRGWAPYGLEVINRRRRTPVFRPLRQASAAGSSVPLLGCCETRSTPRDQPAGRRTTGRAGAVSPAQPRREQ